MRKWLGSGVLALAAVALIAGRPRPSPLTLLDSFDQALSLATDAAEKRMAEIERNSEHAARSQVSFAELVERVERQVAIAEEAATTKLDRALASATALSLERRCAVLECIDRHAAAAADDLTRASASGDNDLARLEADEYRATLRRLRAVSSLVRLRVKLV